jgi:hypothetical protein
MKFRKSNFSSSFCVFFPLKREAKGQGHEKDFLTVGCMGHASSIAMGIAMAKPKRQVS